MNTQMHQIENGYLRAVEKTISIISNHVDSAVKAQNLGLTLDSRALDNEFGLAIARLEGAYVTAAAICEGLLLEEEQMDFIRKLASAHGEARETILSHYFRGQGLLWTHLR